MSRPRRHFTIWIALAVVSAAALPVRADDIRVTVVAVLASDRHKNIDPKLAGLANEVRQRDSGLTGFKLERTTSKVVALNQKEAFPLVTDVTADVTILSRDEKEKKIRLTVKAPYAGEITYTTVYDKYFPVLTRYQTDKDKERLILAIMVKPEPAKEKDKDKKSPEPGKESP